MILSKLSEIQLWYTIAYTWYIELNIYLLQYHMFSFIHLFIRHKREWIHIFLDEISIYLIIKIKSLIYFQQGHGSNHTIDKIQSKMVQMYSFIQ